MNVVNSLCCSSPKSRMMATADMASSVMNRRADARYFMRVWCLWVKSSGQTVQRGGLKQWSDF